MQKDTTQPREPLLDEELQKKGAEDVPAAPLKPHQRPGFRDRPGLGIFYVTMAVVVAAIANLFFKDCMLAGVNILEVGFSRAIVMCAIFSPMIRWYFKKNFFEGIPKREKGFLLGRAFMGQISFLAFIFSLQVLPMATAATLFHINTMLIAILAYIALKESLHYIEIIGLVLCFVGVVIIERSDPSTTEQYDLTHLRTLGIVICLIAAVAFAVT